jgi:hypothetical protein
MGFAFNYEEKQVKTFHKTTELRFQALIMYNKEDFMLRTSGCDVIPADHFILAKGRAWRPT